MNKLRVLWLSLAVLSSGLFLSCQSPKEQGPRQWVGVVKVNVDGTFSDRDGVVLVPSSPSFLDASMAYIYCQFNQAGLTSGKINVTLLGEPVSIDGASHLVEDKGASNDVVGNAAVYDLRVSGSGGAGYIPAFFDAKTLVLPVSFFVKNETDPAALLAEVAKHSFPLVCYTAPIANGDTELKLYLRHVVAGDVSTARNTGTWIFRAYSLSDALQAFRTKSGNEKPLQVVVYYEQNSYSDLLTGSNTTQKMIEIPYSF